MEHAFIHSCLLHPSVIILDVFIAVAVTRLFTLGPTHKLVLQLLSVFCPVLQAVRVRVPCGGLAMEL